MLIETTLGATPGRTPPMRVIKHFGKEIIFKQVLPGRLVASVTGEQEVVSLLKTNGYREFTDKLPEAPTTLAASTSGPTPIDARGSAPSDASEAEVKGLRAEVERLTDVVADLTAQLAEANAGKNADAPPPPPADFTISPGSEPVAGVAIVKADDPDQALRDAALEQQVDALLGGKARDVVKRIDGIEVSLAQAALKRETGTDNPRESIVAALSKIINPDAEA